METEAIEVVVVIVDLSGLAMSDACDLFCSHSALGTSFDFDFDLARLYSG